MGNDDIERWVAEHQLECDGEALLEHHGQTVMGCRGGQSLKFWRLHETHRPLQLAFVEAPLSVNALADPAMPANTSVLRQDIRQLERLRPCIGPRIAAD